MTLGITLCSLGVLITVVRLLHRRYSSPEIYIMGITVPEDAHIITQTPDAFCRRSRLTFDERGQPSSHRVDYYCGRPGDRSTTFVIQFADHARCEALAMSAVPRPLSIHAIRLSPIGQDPCRDGWEVTLAD